MSPPRSSKHATGVGGTMTELQIIVPTWLTYFIAVWIILYILEVILKTACIILDWYLGRLTRKNREERLKK